MKLKESENNTKRYITKCKYCGSEVMDGDKILHKIQCPKIGK